MNEDQEAKIDLGNGQTLTIRGLKGDSPTDEELIALITPLIPDPIAGHTPTDEELLTLIKPLIPKIKDSETPSDEHLISLIKPLIPKPIPLELPDFSWIEKQLKELDSKIKKTPEVKEIIAEIKNLKGNDRIDISNIRNWENLLKKASGNFDMNDQRWHGGGGSGSGTSGDYTPLGVTTTTTGGIIAGTNLGVVPVTVQSIFDLMLYPFIAPTFTSFSITGQSTTVEVGTTISGSKSFAWTFSDISLVTASTMDIIDVTGAVNLATNISISSPSSQNIGTIQLILPGSYLWKGSADDTQLTTFNSSNFTVSWLWKRYVGVNASTTLTEAQIEALAVDSSLASSLSGTYVFVPSATYKYFTCPSSFATPTATTGFKDNTTQLPIGMAGVAEGYTLTDANGWSYLSVNATNAQGILIAYRVYRSKFVLNGSITIAVS